jgi:hypothetical protein
VRRGVEAADLVAVRFMLGRRVLESRIGGGDGQDAARGAATGATRSDCARGGVGPGETEQSRASDGEGGEIRIASAAQPTAPSPADVAALPRARRPSRTGARRTCWRSRRIAATPARLAPRRDRSRGSGRSAAFVDGQLPGVLRVLRRDGAAPPARSPYCATCPHPWKASGRHSQVVAGLVRLGAPPCASAISSSIMGPSPSTAARSSTVATGGCLALAARERAEGRTS